MSPYSPRRVRTRIGTSTPPGRRPTAGNLSGSVRPRAATFTWPRTLATTAACGSAGSRCETETATSTRAATPTASGRTSWLRLRQPPMSGSRRSVLLETEWPGSGTTRTRAGITTSTSCRFSSEPDRTGSDCRLKSRSPLPPRRTSKRTRRFSPMTTRAECGSRTTRPEPTGAKTFAMDRR